MAGFVETMLLTLRVMVWEGGFFLRSRHFVWMTPSSDLLLFTALGVCAAGLTAWRGDSPLVRRLVFGLCIFTSVLAWFMLVRGLEAIACGLIALGVAARGSPWLDKHRERFDGLVRRTLPVLFLILVISAGMSFFRDVREASWNPEGRRAEAGDGRNVVLVVLDTVRADRMSLYGYPRDTTPNLRRLAEESTLFSQARAASTWTLPSHASMFTGRWPSSLGVERLGWLDAAAPTLAETFRDAGRGTAGFVANPFFCGRESGLSRGFQVYADYPVAPGEVVRSSTLGWFLARSWLRLSAWATSRVTSGAVRDVDLDFSRKDAAQVSGEFLDWLDRRGDQPFFVFLNFFDAHDPYIPPSGYPSTFAADGRPDTPHLMRDWQYVDKTKLTPSDVEFAQDSYDDCLVSLDAQLGDLIEALRERGVLDETVLIVTSDHGEQFGEHGSFGHGLSLHDEEVRVPLLIRAPGLAPTSRVVDEPVSLRDIAATALELSELTSEASPLPGVSLASTWEEDGEERSPSYFELRDPIGERTLRTDSGPQADAWKGVAYGCLVYLLGGDGRESLYDVSVDPEQLHDRSDDPEMAETLEEYRRLLADVD